MTAGGCLGERVSEYVDGSLSEADILACQTHLIACALCRSEVELERRLLRTLREDPSMPSELMGLLISVSQEIPVRAPAAERATRESRPPRAPSVPMLPTPIAFAPTTLRVLDQNAPAQHRSALRAAVLATAAAGASMAAAWAFSVTSSAASAPATAVPGGRATSNAPAATGVGTVISVAVVRGADRTAGAAESTP